MLRISWNTFWLWKSNEKKIGSLLAAILLGIAHNSVADPGFGQGGAPEFFSEILPMQQSEFGWVSYIILARVQGLP